MTPDHARLNHLEALRGIAAIIVVVYHIYISLFPALSGRWYATVLETTPANLLIAGPQMVVFFFVLSGFVLPLGVLRSRRLGNFLKAIIKRFPRLYLPAAVSILVGAICFLGLPSFYRPVAVMTQSEWLGRFAGAPFVPEAPSLWLAARQTLSTFFGPSASEFNSPLWTMRAELTGSLHVLCLSLIWLLAPGWRRWSLLLLASALLGGLMLVSDQYLFPFFPGLLLAVLIGTRRVVFNGWVCAALVLLGLFLLSFSENSGIYAWIPTSNMILVATAGAVLLITGVHCSTLLAQGLGGRVGKTLGQISFPLYLMQVVGLMYVGCPAFLLARSYGASLETAAVIGGIMALAGTFALAMPILYLDVGWRRLLDRTLVRSPLATIGSVQAQNGIPVGRTS